MLPLVHHLSQFIERTFDKAKKQKIKFLHMESLEDRTVPSFGVSGLLSPTSAGAVPIAEVGAGPRLLGVDTTQSVLLNNLLRNLTGGGALSLSAVDYNGLGNADVNLNTLLGALQVPLGVATPAQALTTNATLGQIFTAAASAASAEGDTATATLFNNIAVTVAPLTGTLRLGDLFDLNLPAGSLAQADLNALDLLTGAVQLFNFNNVATTPAPLTISGAALGLGSLLISFMAAAFCCSTA